MVISNKDMGQENKSLAIESKQSIRCKQLQRNRIYEQRWCFGRTFWLSWSKERQKHNKDLVELRASSSQL